MTRARLLGARRLHPKAVSLEVRPADLLAADLSRPFDPPVPAAPRGSSLAINWVVSPGAKGSGGHTTLFRIINHLEALGFKNQVYLYDAHGVDHEYYRSIVRDDYGFRGPVHRYEGTFTDAHGLIATSWNTAYPVFNARCAGKRFYFVQDFEPSFYPAGSVQLLAENTYRMGFHGITIGDCFAGRLREQYGMTVDSFAYGCDTSRYRRDPRVARRGVVFYARPAAPRRGFELGMVTLEVLARRRPDVEIHIYGERLGHRNFRFHDHGHISPDELNGLYNRCHAGLTLSFTNVSLVALEMLAAGCVPVTNESDLIRRDIRNVHIRYAAPHPHALAAAIEDVLSSPSFDQMSAAAAASVKSSTWDDAGNEVAAILRHALS